MIEGEVRANSDFWKEVRGKSQSDQVKAIANALIKLGLKEEDYSLGRTYIPKWKNGRTARPSSLHYLAYQFYLQITNC